MNEKDPAAILVAELLRLAECARAHAHVARSDPDAYVAAVADHFLQVIPMVADVRKGLAALDAKDGQAVAWMTPGPNPFFVETCDEATEYCADGEQPIPLYTTPQPAARKDGRAVGFITVGGDPLLHGGIRLPEGTPLYTAGPAAEVTIVFGGLGEATAICYEGRVVLPQVTIDDLLHRAKPAAREDGQAAADRYDAGLLSDYGGGNVEWWQDYIRSELDRAHDFYTEALAAPQPAAPAVEPDEPWRSIHELDSETDDLFWFMRGDVIDGPRPPQVGGFDADEWDWFARAEPPSCKSKPAPAVPEGWRECYSAVIGSLAKIVSLGGDDAMTVMDAIPRPPVMDEVFRIRGALNKLGATFAAPSQPAAPAVPEWFSDVVRCLEDVSTQQRATGKGDSRMQQLLARMHAWLAAAPSREGGGS